MSYSPIPTLPIIPITQEELDFIASLDLWVNEKSPLRKASETRIAARAKIIEAFHKKSTSLDLR